jgi:glucans biosynthesis protein
MGWSGFRIRTRLNRPDVMDEFLVFQGASYFRAVARGTLYGLSARGLAIKTGSPDGEEFPLFTDFWIAEPEHHSDTVRIYAILDSRSVAGAYQFDVTPGPVTTVQTRLALFPRVELRETGIAPGQPARRGRLSPRLS